MFSTIFLKNGEKATLYKYQDFVAEMFVLYKQGEKITCSFSPNFQIGSNTIYYIGVTDGLGSYHSFLNKGYVRRSFENSHIKDNSKRLHFQKIQEIKNKFLYKKFKLNRYSHERI